MCESQHDVDSPSPSRDLHSSLLSNEMQISCKRPVNPYVPVGPRCTRNVVSPAGSEWGSVKANPWVATGTTRAPGGAAGAV
jgi:hypothetical protein